MYLDGNIIAVLEQLTGNVSLRTAWRDVFFHFILSIVVI
jgi:hypothetical protein